VAWWDFVAARFPQYSGTAFLVYVLHMGWDDECQDEGHEFWCRKAEGTCRRQGAMSCNDDGSWEQPEPITSCEELCMGECQGACGVL
jgi:hypothetical protein